MLTRREYYIRLGVGAVAATAWWAGGSIVLSNFGLGYGVIILIDILVTGGLLSALGVYPERYSLYKSRYLMRTEDSRAESRIQIAPPAP